MNITLGVGGEIIMTAGELASLCSERVKPGRLYYTERSDSASLENGEISPELSHRFLMSGEVFVINAESDGIYTTEDGVCTEKRRYVRKLSPNSSPWSDPQILAEAFITAYLVCIYKGVTEITLTVTLCSDTAQKSFDIKLSSSYLSVVVNELIKRACPFAKAKKAFLTKGIHDIRHMPFPYSSIREGQVDFIKEAYRTIKKGKCLLAVAPTGIGKTVSALYPAVKAVGDGLADRVFYLTAKTVTGKACLDAARLMNQSAAELRAVSVIAKERICPAKDNKNPFTTDECGYMCPRMCPSGNKSYRMRRDEALTELLQMKGVYESETIKAIAEKYAICPFELSLDLSEYCQIIVCDYNYVFDANVRFKRYFDVPNGEHIFLVDEAHNLPDRAREMYSSVISQKNILKLRGLIAEFLPGEGGLLLRLDEVLSAFEKTAFLCRKNSDSADGTGYYLSKELPDEFAKPFEQLSETLYTFKKDYSENEDIVELTEKVSKELFDLLNSCKFFDDHFTFYAEALENDIKIKLMCLDPSKILGTYMKSAIACVLFSATLTPLDYFSDIMGIPEAKTIELESPYDPDNLCIAAVDCINTKYSSRQDTAEQIAEAILSTVSCKNGNYMVYFPSYGYLKTVIREFLKIAPKDIKVAMQKSGMSLKERDKFLSYFTAEQDGKTLVGFCVLGGLFSEGIDLAGSSLIGSILVGIGLPGLSSELNIMKEYYDRTREDGYNFAYVYPGMIKVLQAAGRVIRSENDCGVAVLIDDRYHDPNIMKLFPSHWKNLHYIGNIHSLEKYIKKFWDEHR